TGQSEVRRSRRLSASFVATGGNYEDGFYWHFYQDGSLSCGGELTRVMNTTPLPPRRESPSRGGGARRLNAPFHQHIFVARIDPCIDGEKNTVYEVNTRPLPRGADNPHGNAFRAEATLLATEKAARRSVNAATARFWRIVNRGKRSR